MASKAEVTLKRVFVGNLGTNVTADDLTQLFGLAKTDFLKKTCSLELVQWKKDDDVKNYAFMSVPTDVFDELVKLNGIEFYGREVKIEEARKTEIKEEPNGEAVSDPTKRTAYRGGRGMLRGRGGRGRGRGGFMNGRRWGSRPGGRFSVPVLEKDQLLHLVDCGVNLTNPKFMRDSDQAIARALASGVKKMVVTGLKLAGSKYAVILARSHPDICYAAVGIHPHFVKDDWNEKSVGELDALLQLPQVVAIGECGLDLNRNFSPEELQLKAFKAHVELAVKHNKPLLVHERDATDKILQVLKEYEGRLPTVIIHCFTGTAEHIKAYLDKGFYIGVTGFLCKEKHGAHLRESIRDGVLPLNRVVVQSNAPYMIPNLPQEHMDPVSKVLLESCWIENEPCTLQLVVRTIAKCLSEDPVKIAQECLNTANHIFKLQE